jgi:hypothetical protein
MKSFKQFVEEAAEAEQPEQQSYADVYAGKVALARQKQQERVAAVRERLTDQQERLAEKRKKQKEREELTKSITRDVMSKMSK